MREPSERPSRSVATRHFRIRRLRRSELPAPTLELARFLIGKTLVRELPAGRIIGRIVETEAYPPGDAAGHAFRGETPRNRSLFLDRGHAYVYFSYGSFWLLNVSSERPGIGAGVLFRALEVVDGFNLIRSARGKTARHIDLARGPGGLALPCESIGASMARIYVPKGRCGWGRKYGHGKQLVKACGSEFRVRWTGRFDSMNVAILP